MSKKSELFRQRTQDRMSIISPNLNNKEEVEITVRRMSNAKMINLKKIKPDPKQPRKQIINEALKGLAESIKNHGIMHPITVEYIQNEDYYRIISGERRFQASKIAGLKEIPCIVYNGLENKDRYAKQLIENIQREDLSPIDRARALLEFKDMLGPDAIWEQVEKLVGIGETRRKQFIALLNLPENIQNEIVTIGSKRSEKDIKNQITEKHARALLGLNKFPEKQNQLFEYLKNSIETITGNEAIKIAKEMKGEKALKTFKISYTTEQELIRILEKKLETLKSKLKGHPGDPFEKYRNK